MTAVRQVWLVALREVRERSRSRSFRAGLVAMLVVVVAMIVVPGLLDSREDTRHVGLTGAVSQELSAAIRAQADALDVTVRLHEFDDVASGESAVRDDEIDVLVVDSRRLEWQGPADQELQAVVTGGIQVVTVQERAVAVGVTRDDLLALVAPVEIENVEIGLTEGRGPDDGTAAMVMTTLLLLAIVIYVNLVLTGVVEEKSSRVVEVLLARMPARNLLAGKVAGIGLLGFAQFAVTALAALVATLAVDTVDIPAIGGATLAWAVAWFVLGYALFAMVYGAVGSLASRSEDAQSAAGPVGYLLVAGYWVAFLAVGQDPDGLWSRILSYVPATAPFAMPGRIALDAVAWWEPPLAVALTLLAVAGLVVAAGRIYTNAILHSGPRLRLRDAWAGARVPTTGPAAGPAQ